MDVNKLRKIIKDQGLYVKENYKNIVCICPYCGDHPTKSKKGHYYVSIDPALPICRCFIGGHPGTTINKFVYDITGDLKLSNSIVSKEELKKSREKAKRTATFKERSVRYKIPNLKQKLYSEKCEYIKKRTHYNVNVCDIPNLIFNFSDFFRLNYLKSVEEYLERSNFLRQLNDSFIGFLSENHTRLFCRNIVSSGIYKFRKIKLQTDPLNMLDYVSWRGGDHTSDVIVLAEGTFDIASEYYENSLGLRDKCRLYAAGQSFSYRSLLRSVCYDENLFQTNVVILSDEDKKPYTYIKFKKDTKHIVNSIKLYYNNAGNDFGCYPIKPVRVEIPEYTFKYRNKSQNTNCF